MKTTTTLMHGAALFGMLFLIGSSCSDNSGLKAQLAAQQAQAQYQAQLAQAQLQNQKLQDKNACLTANPNNPSACQTVGN
jgi:hypothetical protein